MKQIRVFMIHNKIHSTNDFLSYLNIKDLASNYEFIWDENNPEYLISSEQIYLFKKSFSLFKKLYSKKRINIFMGGEYMIPDFNVFDYAVGYHDDLKCNDRYAQLLTPDIHFDRGFIKRGAFKKISKDEAYEILKTKTGFCDFLYSNSRAHPNRDFFFHLLSKYKKVDSLGAWLNNVGRKGTGYMGHEGDIIPIKAPYKFSIAFENCYGKGYTSEKILTSLQAHCIPIYWGDPDIARIVNSKAFVNCNEFNSFEEVIEKIKQIDQDDALWCEMASQPWQNEENIAYAKERNEYYYNFWINIFEQDYEKCHRVACGTHPENYIEWVKSAYPIIDGRLKTIIIRKMKTLFRIIRKK